jgi:hypothetical protein
MQNEIQRALDQAADAAERAKEAAEEAAEAGKAIMTPSAEIIACEGCGEEDFGWLDAEARADVIDISADPKIAKLQHRLRHAVISLRDAAVKGQKHKIFDLEDAIEDTHEAIEKLRRRGNPYRWNPWW